MEKEAVAKIKARAAEEKIVAIEATVLEAKRRMEKRVEEIKAAAEK